MKTVRWALTGLVLAWAIATGTPAAAGQPDQADLATVVTALGLTPLPAEYVVAVDTSKSMGKSGKYAKVKSATAGLIASLEPTDRLVIITFDSVARVRYDGPVGTDPGRPLAALPARPGGNDSDLGLGIAAGLAKLDPAAGDRLGAFVLISDGRISADAGSRFRKLGSDGWIDLRQQAAELTNERQIRAYSIAMADEKDGEVLRSVFPNTAVVPAPDIAQELSSVSADLRTSQARAALTADATAQLEVHWEPAGVSLPAGGSSPARLRVRSTTSHLPVQLDQLAVTVDDRPLAVSGLPDQLVLGPGQTVDLPLELTSPTTAAGDLHLAARITSPWSDVLNSDLGLPLNLGLSETGQAEADTGLGATGWAALVTLALLAAAAFAIQWLRPSLAGTVTVTDGAAVVLAEVLLAGRRAEVKLEPAAGRPGLSAVVIGARVRPRDRARVLLRGRIGFDPVREQLLDEQPAAAGPYRFLFESVHSRATARIG